MLPARTLEERFLRLKLINQQAAQDPLQYWRFGVPRLKAAFGLLAGSDAINELYLRKPNRSGGTYTLAAWMVACLQKRPELNGVPIPQWRGRVEGVQFVLDYKRMLLSVQPAYERVLRNWPHKIRRQGSAISDLRIKPWGGSDNEETWSVIHFLSEDNPNAAVGIRADVVGIDEPPPIHILQEMRKAAHAGRSSKRVIAATPEHMRQWAPLRADYGDTPRRSLRRVDRWRAECRWSLDEVADWVLSPDEKQEMRDAYWDPETGKARDPLAEARWHGDYTNAEGSTPWTELGMLTLLEMLSECREPEIEEWRVSRETTEAGETATVATVPVEFWATAKKGKTYYLDVDPASGQDDGRHNPAGLQVAEEGSGDLVARWNGYLAPYSVGVLAASLARQYNGAWVDIEMKDHWGVNVVRGCHASRYYQLASEKRELKPGVWAKEVGFDQNEETKAIIIGQIQEWIDAWRAGHKYARCSSRAVIECLINAELDDRGKVIAGPGVAHFEDGILWGQKLRRAVSRLNREIPQTIEPTRTVDDYLADLVSGRITEE